MYIMNKYQRILKERDFVQVYKYLNKILIFLKFGHEIFFLFLLRKEEYIIYDLWYLFSEFLKIIKLDRVFNIEVYDYLYNFIF